MLYCTPKSRLIDKGFTSHSTQNR